MTSPDQATDEAQRPERSVLVDRDGAVATVRLNRPDRKNALIPSMMEELAGHLSDLGEDPDVRAIVLTGAGASFCAGGDIQAMAAGSESGQPATDRPRRTAASAAAEIGRFTMAIPVLLATMPKPVIAAIPGAVAGAGLGLALACDLRVASEDAVLSTGFLGVGLTDDWGASFFLTQLAGPAVARELLFLGDRIDARRALELGLVNRLVSSAQLVEVTNELAHRLAAAPPFAIGAIKDNVLRALRGDLMESARVESLHHALAHHSADHREAIRARVEKRPPQFLGS